MVSLNTLQFISGQKKADAKALLSKERYVASVYLMGYAVEIALKRKICKTLQFNSGFPENPRELQACIASVATANPTHPSAGTAVTFTNVKEIKNHDLAKLLRYSGQEYHVKTGFLTDWTNIVGWNPETRYVRQQITKARAQAFVKSALIVIREIV